MGVTGSGAEEPAGPATDGAERALRRLPREILEMNGSAVLLTCSALAGEQDMVALFQAAMDDEYDEILDKCRDFHAGLDKEYRANHFTYGELEENEVELVKLKNWYAKVAAREVFGAPERAAAVEALETLVLRSTYSGQLLLRMTSTKSSRTNDGSKCASTSAFTFPKVL